jgi:hypothetical protein
VEGGEFIIGMHQFDTCSTTIKHRRTSSHYW